MGRPAKGAVRSNPRTSVWEVRVTLLDGERNKPIAMTGLAPCTVVPADPPDECTCASCTFANDSGQKVSRRMRDGGAVDPATQETVAEWFGRYFDWREKRGKRAESIDDSRGRIRKWVERNEQTPLGRTAMVRVTAAMLEDFVAFLDEQVEDEVIAPKTAINIFGGLSAGFAVATRCKEKALRVLTSNPAA